MVMTVYKIWDIKIFIIVVATRNIIAVVMTLYSIIDLVLFISPNFGK